MKRWPRGWCAASAGRHWDLVIKERPVVAVRDLPLAGRVANPLWRKRRFRCRGCRRTHTEQHLALLARQRASGRFRWRLAAHAADGGAHAEIAREEGTLAGLGERIAQRFLCLAACVWLNHRFGRPSRSLVADVA